MRRVIDIHNLASRAGTRVCDAQAAGRELFRLLEGKKSDLAKALIGASAASGLEPRQVLSIVGIIAEDFRRPMNAPSSVATPADRNHDE